MSTNEIILSINNLPFTDRLKIVEMILETIKESHVDKLEQAALLMLEDYKNDKSLTELTTLDIENFYETRGNLAS